MELWSMLVNPERPSFKEKRISWEWGRGEQRGLNCVGKADRCKICVKFLVAISHEFITNSSKCFKGKAGDLRTVLQKLHHFQQPYDLGSPTEPSTPPYHIATMWDDTLRSKQWRDLQKDPQITCGGDFLAPTSQLRQMLTPRPTKWLYCLVTN